jgi:hypothetical protein
MREWKHGRSAEAAKLIGMGGFVFFSAVLTLICTFGYKTKEYVSTPLTDTVFVLIVVSLCVCVGGVVRGIASTPSSDRDAPTTPHRRARATDRTRAQPNERH